MADEETKIEIGVAWSGCHEPDGDHVHLAIIRLPHGFSETVIDHLAPVVNAAVVEFFDGLGKIDRSKMQ